jgi:aminoglycoside phosphotransferase (APT) family kinase protein
VLDAQPTDLSEISRADAWCECSWPLAEDNEWHSAGSLPVAAYEFGVELDVTQAPRRLQAGSSSVGWVVRDRMGRWYRFRSVQPDVPAGSLACLEIANTLFELGVPTVRPRRSPARRWIEHGPRGEAWQCWHWLQGRPVLGDDKDITAAARALRTLHIELASIARIAGRSRAYWREFESDESLVATLRRMPVRPGQITVMERHLEALNCLGTLPDTIAHGDCHPGNLLMTDAAKVAIFDFDLTGASAGGTLTDIGVMAHRFGRMRGATVRRGSAAAAAEVARLFGCAYGATTTEIALGLTLALRESVAKIAGCWFQGHPGLSAAASLEIAGNHVAYAEEIALILNLMDPCADRLRALARG